MTKSTVGSKAVKKANPSRKPRVHTLEKYNVEPGKAKNELNEIELWLNSQQNFSEISQAIPEFLRRRNLCAAIGTTFGDHLNHPDHLSFELGLGGNYFPDLVIGDSNEKSLVLVEFEGAEKSQIFLEKLNGLQYPAYSAKFHQGFFQLLDWMHRIKDANEKNLEDWFNFIPKKIATLLVVGRDYELGTNNQSRRRLDSLAESFNPGNNKLSVVTYDGLIHRLKGRLHSSI